MTPGGWIVLVVSVGTVLSLFAWCMTKVMATPDETDHMRGITDHTPDEEK